MLSKLRARGRPGQRNRQALATHPGHRRIRIPPRFEYFAPATLGEALDILGRYSGEAYRPRSYTRDRWSTRSTKIVLVSWERIARSR